MRPRRDLVGPAAALLVVLVTGCPEPEPSGPCAVEGDPLLMMANRDGGPPLSDGDEVEVFPPPQGGVFTELDVSIDDMEVDELEDMVVRIEALDTGESLAVVRYFGPSLGMILRCTEDDVLVVDNLPVGFGDAFMLTDLDGVPAVLTGTLETTRGDFETRVQVVLRATDY